MELEQEVAGRFVLALAGQAWLADSSVAAPEQAVADIATAGQLDIGSPDYEAEPAVGNWSD